MQKLSSRKYAGTPGEVVTVSTILSGAGAVKVVLDGSDLGATRQFSLGPAGTQHKLTITLVAAPGVTCGIGIAVVNGTVDTDALVSTTTDPFPMSKYEIRVGDVVPMVLPAGPGMPFAAAAGAATKTTTGNAGRKRPASKAVTKKSRKSAPMTKKSGDAAGGEE